MISESGGLLHGKYPLICGGLLISNQFSSLCHIIPNIDGLTEPYLPNPYGYAGHAVINNSLLWISGRVMLLLVAISHCFFQI